LAELVRLAGEYSGHPRTVVPLSPALSRFQAWLMEWLPGEPLLTRDNLASLAVPSIAHEGMPGLDALGIQPTPLAAIAPGVLNQQSPAVHLAELRARSR
jgi:NADH dehydrogenase